MRFIIPFMVLILCMPIVTADAPQPGITPDNVILWRFDLWTEKFLIAITLDQKEKIGKSFAAAEERLTEMEKMLYKNKLRSAEKAKIEHDDAIENTHSYILYLDYDDKEVESEKEIELEEALLEYNDVVDIVEARLADVTLDEESSIFVADVFLAIESKEESIADELEKKKQETTVVSDEEIPDAEAFEEYIAQETEDIIEKAEDITEEITAAVVAELGDVISVEDEQVAVVSDTSSKSKVRIEGTVTDAQMNLITALHESLQQNNIEAEIEITVTERIDGGWTIEKEVKGQLSTEQNQLLDQLFGSLGDADTVVRIQIKHNY